MTKQTERTGDDFERSIREKVHAAGILTQGEWVYLVGTFQLCRERGEDERDRLAKRPAMFRVMDDNIWRVFSDEREAADYAEKIGIGDYQGLYVRDGQ